MLEYQSPDCVDEQILLSLKSKMAAMEASLKDKLASGALSWEGQAAAKDREQDEISLQDRDHQEVYGHLKEFGQNKRAKGEVKSLGVTPTRKDREGPAFSKQNSNISHQRQYESVNISNKTAQNPGSIMDSTGVLDRSDLHNLKKDLETLFQANRQRTNRLPSQRVFR